MKLNDVDMQSNIQLDEIERIYTINVKKKIVYFSGKSRETFLIRPMPFSQHT